MSWVRDDSAPAFPGIASPARLSLSHSISLYCSFALKMSDICDLFISTCLQNTMDQRMTSEYPEHSRQATDGYRLVQ